MERKLLARTRMYDGVTGIEEQLNTRYGGSGLGASQKSYLVLKPTGSSRDNLTTITTQEQKQLQIQSLDEIDSLTFDEKKKRRIKLARLPGPPAGIVPEDVDWRVSDVGKKKYLKGKDGTRKTCNLKKLEKISESILLKKTKKTTRLAFREYVKHCRLKQQKIVKILEKKVENIIKDRLQNSLTNELLVSEFEISKIADELIQKYKLFEYTDYSGIHESWNMYIRDLTQIKKISNSTLPSSAIPGVLTKMASAEYIGAIIRVIKSTDQALVNLVGMVLYEFQHMWMVIVPRGLKYGPGVLLSDQRRALEEYGKENISLDKMGYSFKEHIGGIRLIEKKTCLFKVVLPIDVTSGQNQDSSLKPNSKPSVSLDSTQTTFPMQVTIIGPRFCFRSADRSSKKLKNHSVDKLRLLWDDDKDQCSDSSVVMNLPLHSS